MYDVNTNGERDVLRQSTKGEAPMLFDVGANVGEWSAMAGRIFAKATIHAFELNPKTAKLLAERFSKVSTVHVHPFGLSASSGEVNFFAYAGDSSVLSSLRNPLHSHVPHQVEQATVRKGDDFCRELDIRHVDFLKVDAEGADYEVLAGFSEMLENQNVSVVQFEHQGGRYLWDFYNLLCPKGYSLGKLYSNYVDFCEHSAELEHFLGPNYIAVPSKQKELIQALQRGW